MTEEIHPFLQLRRIVRNSVHQFRHSNDNSESLFHPEKGFVYAYDIGTIEEALSDYEETLPTAFIDSHRHITKEEELIQLGSRLCAACEDTGAREFAQEVVAYLIGEQMERNGSLASLMTDTLELEPSIPESL